MSSIATSCQKGSRQKNSRTVVVAVIAAGCLIELFEMVKNSNIYNYIYI